MFLSPVPTLSGRRAQRSLFLSPVSTLRRKKGTEKLVPVSCAHAEAKEGHRGACSCLLCPRWVEEGHRGACSCLLCPLCGARRNTGGTRLVYGKPTLRACTQFINVSQRALHIYWQFSAMSHAIHKIVSKRRCQSYFISRRSPHHGISKDSDLCASVHRCPHYARLCFRNFQFI